METREIKCSVCGLTLVFLALPIGTSARDWACNIPYYLCACQDLG